MKPFVAITVLVAASLTAVSAAPAQQQVALGSRPAGQGLGQSGGLSVSGGLSSPGNLRPSFAGQASHPGGFLPSGASFGGQVGGGAFGYPYGVWQGQGPSTGNLWAGSYPGSHYYQYPSYFPSFYGQSAYAPSNGNGVYWGQTPVHGGSGYWGFTGNGYGSAGVSPAGFLFGGLGSQGFANFPGQLGAGQSSIPWGSLSSARGSSGSVQSPVRR